MTDNEIIEYLKKNEENTIQIRTAAEISVIKYILHKNNLITREKFEELTDKLEEELRKMQIENATLKEREQIETMIKFSNLFGGGINEI